MSQSLPYSRQWVKVYSGPDSESKSALFRTVSQSLLYSGQWVKVCSVPGSESKSALFPTVSQSLLCSWKWVKVCSDPNGDGCEKRYILWHCTYTDPIHMRKLKESSGCNYDKIQYRDTQRIFPRLLSRWISRENLRLPARGIFWENPGVPDSESKSVLFRIVSQSLLCSR